MRVRLAEYSQMGARFAKWRAVITIGDDIPSRGCIEANAHALARYAALCQEASLVPIVEPEVLMDGEHTVEWCFEVTGEVLRTVFSQLHTQRVALEHMILMPNMVLPGNDCPKQDSVEEVADATVPCMSCHTPHTWKVTSRETCLTCHEDKKTHYAPTFCGECHKFAVG